MNSSSFCGIGREDVKVVSYCELLKTPLSDYTHESTLRPNPDSKATQEIDIVSA
jgi:hypothetical protein